MASAFAGAFGFCAGFFVLRCLNGEGSHSQKVYRQECLCHQGRFALGA